MSILNLFVNASRDAGMILANRRCRNKLRIIGRYLLLTGKEIAIRRGWSLCPDVEDIGGHAAQFLSYGTLLSLWREVYAETPYYFESPSQRPVILDVGSNIGISVLFFKHLYPEARITAFEPDPRAYSVLQANVELNHLQDVRLVNKAAYNRTGVIEWHYSSAHADSLSMSAVPRETLPDTVLIPCARLSEYVDGPVDFLKLDVEGAEGEVLEELHESGKIQLIREMAIEFHPWASQSLSAVLENLKDAGFTARAERENPAIPIMVFAHRDRGAPHIPE